MAKNDAFLSFHGLNTIAIYIAVSDRLSLGKLASRARTSKEEEEEE